MAASAAWIFVWACHPSPSPPDSADKSGPIRGDLGAHTDAPSSADASVEGAGSASPGTSEDAAASALSVHADAASASQTVHYDTRAELLALITLPPRTVASGAGLNFLNQIIGPGGPGRMNQGNKAIARHSISKASCLAGLEGIVLQTPDARAKCGAENMVPVWLKGKDAWFCIDIFEFPNKACELPFVWTAPTHAKKLCELQGKRLCAQTEWNIACRGDPEGGHDSRYAYGNTLDLDICHTNLRHRQPCNPISAKTAFDTCTTDTEPSGSFPKCRSRFGVFDQHGNVAEVMMRREGDQVFTQLKGSAWFYTELAREPDKPVPESTTSKASAYPDHCNFDPRWHVEPIENAHHVNYHLGFRCCKSIP